MTLLLQRTAATGSEAPASFSSLLQEQLYKKDDFVVSKTNSQLSPKGGLGFVPCQWVLAPPSVSG